jgi:zinc transporter ZupT
MNTPVYQLIIFSLAAAAANVAGGMVLFPTSRHRNYKEVLRYLLALGAGFMFAVTLFEILPKTIILWQSKFPEPKGDLYIPMALLIAGYLLTQFFEHTIAPHFHLGEQVPSGKLLTTSSAYTAVFGLLIHSFFDGVSIAAASQLDPKLGLLVFIAVAMHKFPEGFTIGSMILASGKNFREVAVATSIIGITTILGVFAFTFVGTNFGGVEYALPIAGGVTLYVAASDLIPEVNHHGGNRLLISLSVFAGVALFFGTHYLLHEALEM